MAKNPGTKISTYTWVGTDRNGKVTKGEMDGTSVAFVNTALRRQGIRPKKVRKKAKPLFSFGGRVTMKDIAFTARQMATMINAGIPIAQTLSALSRGQEKKSLQELLTTIRQDVEAGTSLSQSLKPFPQHFDRLFTNLVAVGEESGTLDILLDKVALHMEKVEAIKSKIKSAMFYPAAIIVVAIVVVSLLMIFVIPQFEALFQGFGGDLPTLTRFMVTVSEWFQKFWYIGLGAIIFGFIAFRYTYKRSDKLKFTIDKLSLKLPVFGEVIRKGVLARFARTLATMFGAGVPLMDSLDSVAGACGNRVYEQGILDVRQDISSGRPLEESMARTGLFPGMMLQMVGTGEESGELETMLDKVGEFYEREVDDAVAAISSLIEPFLIAFLGIVVGTVVVAMYLPIFKMAAVF